MPVGAPDFFELDNQLSAVEKGVRSASKSFVEKEVNPIISDCYIEGKFPIDLIPKIAAKGFLGPTLPKKYMGEWS